MFDNLMDPVIKEYLFYDFRRKSFLDKVILAVLVAVLAIFSLLFGWSAFFDDLNPLEVWLWIPYAIIGSIIAYWILSFLDRERRVRFFHIVTLLCVPLVLQPIASYLNDASPAPLWTVGFFEEGLKILPVVLLAIYVPNLIRTRKDGIVYGALAGMGFNILEMGLYLARILHESSMIETWYSQSTRLGLFGFGGHIIWSAFVGMGVGFAAESTAHGWQKWKRAVYFFLIAAVMHSLYDLGVNTLGIVAIAQIELLFRDISMEEALASPELMTGPMNNGMRYGVYLYTIVLIIIMIIQIRRSFAWENTMQEYELTSEEESVITKDELNKLKRERLFFMRKYTDVPKEVGAKMVLYQNLLAMQKHTAAQLERSLEQTEPVAALRGAIQALRSG